MEISLLTKILTICISAVPMLVLFHIWILVRRMSHRFDHAATCPSGETERKKRPRRSVTTVRNAHRSRTSKLLSALKLDKTDKPKDKARRTIITHTLP